MSKCFGKLGNDLLAEGVVLVPRLVFVAGCYFAEYVAE